MKKVISIFLTLLLLFSLCTPVFAYVPEFGSTTPIINISGDSTGIYNAAQELIYPTSVNTEDKDNLVSSVANVLLPFLLDGLLLDKWDHYYDAFEKEIGEIYSQSVLDENGEATNGSGMANSEKAALNTRFSRNISKNGFFDLTDYTYNYAYDWRLDPFVTADDLEAHIDMVLAATGAEKVNLVGRCLGGTVVLAYLEKYGTSKIRSITFDGTVANGCERISEALSGQFYIDMGALKRWKKDENAYKNMRDDPLTFLDSFLVETAELLEATGVGDSLIESFYKTVYKKVYKELISRLGLVTVGTWPGYWAAVKSCDYDLAKETVFGKEGSNKRAQYAGLIEKIDHYDETIRQRIPEILLSAKESGVMVYVMAKYGAQMMPLYQCYDEIGDLYVTLSSSSFGATTAKLTGTLSDEYIAARKAEGKGKYISPDRQVDTSTCVLPDQTWCFKGIIHYNWNTEVIDLILKLIASDTQLSVDSFPEYPAFMVYDKNTNRVFPMTEGNGGTATEWVDAKEEKYTIFEILGIFFQWLLSLVKIIFK